MKNENQLSTEATAQKKKKTPKWLKALEAQSWQAELLISGLVIAGLLQMPYEIEAWTIHKIIHSSEIAYIFYLLISSLLTSAVYILIITFGIHFLLRAIWIALLGLNSVFPNGIIVKSFMTFSEEHMQKVQEEFSDLNAYNQKLDSFSSLLFSFGAMAFMIYGSLSLLICILFLFISFLNFFLPINWNLLFDNGIIIFNIIVFVPLLVFKGIEKSKYGQSSKFKDIKYQFSQWMGKVTHNVFYQPISYIYYILGTNKYKNAVLGLSMLTGAFVTMNYHQIERQTIIEYFQKDKYCSFNNKPYKIRNYNYENLLPEQMPVFTPIIPSEVIRGKTIKLFIPTITRETSQLPELVYEKSDLEQDKNEAHCAKCEANLLRFANFNQIYINEKAYPNLKFRFANHPNNGESGIVTYIPTDNIPIGNNILEIRKNYFSEDGVQKIVKIPFYYEGQ